MEGDLTDRVPFGHQHIFSGTAIERQRADTRPVVDKQILQVVAGQGSRGNLARIASRIIKSKVLDRWNVRRIIAQRVRAFSTVEYEGA